MPVADQPPTSGSAAPWAGSLPGYKPSKAPVILFAIGGAVFASIMIIAALVVLVAQRHRKHADDTTIVATSVAPPEVIELPSASASTSAEVPVVSVDSLPMSTSAKLHIGKLSIDAGPVACGIMIDGKVRGMTPMTVVDLTAGAHSVRCETSSGVAKIVSVSVVEGQTTHHHFLTSP